MSSQEPKVADDPEATRHTGRVLLAARLAQDYGFTDIDGTVPTPLTLHDT